MAKKVRRVRKSRARSQVPKSDSEQTLKEPAPKNRQSATERFQQEYAYVIKDLRHILILAAAMFIMLVVLNVILQ